MNNLSWFIYATQVVDGLRDLAIPFVIFGVIAYGGAAIGMTCFANDIYSGSSYKEEHARLIGLRKQISRVMVPALIVSVLVIAFVPSRQTMLLIAGSEMGERALKSDAVQDIVNPGMDLVKTWIRQESDKLKKSAEK